MNDRLKFRIWDNIDKRYILTGCIDISKGILSVNGFYEKNRFVIEQSTGLKDKNGKLIFEGDIYVPISDRSFKCVVGFIDGAFVAGQINEEFPEPIGWEAIDNQMCRSAEWLNTEVEVIGNIHENPELLGGK